MKILDCPLNGPRNISEFTYGGEVRQMPDPDNASTREWAEYVFEEVITTMDQFFGLQSKLRTYNAHPVIPVVGGVR